jgi:hypothetical protein
VFVVVLVVIGCVVAVELDLTVAVRRGAVAPGVVTPGVAGTGAGQVEPALGRAVEEAPAGEPTAAWGVERRVHDELLTR